MKEKQKQEVDALINSFRELRSNPAYQFMLKEFDDSCLNDIDESDLQTKAERYIAESAVKRFIRQVGIYAAGIPDEVSIIDETSLENENEEIDENENLFTDN
jgi:hypothetical protein